MERRHVLTGIGAAGATLALGPVLAACTGSDPSDSVATPTAGATGTTDPRAAAAVTETALLTLAANIQARWPATEPATAPVQAAHTAHVVALVGTTPTPVTPTDSSGTRLPGSAAAALRTLAAAERTAAEEHAVGAQGADASGARLLASLAAYCAAQDVVLTRASTTTGIGR